MGLKMKTKTTVFYDDNDVQSFNSVKNYLFETFAEEEGWISEDEIPDCVIYHEMEEQQRRDWDDFRADLEYLLEKDCYLLTGTCGRWDGPSRGGKFIQNPKPSQEDRNDIYQDLPDSESADKFFDLNDDMNDVRNNAMDAIRKLQKK